MITQPVIQTAGINLEYRGKMSRNEGIIFPSSGDIRRDGIKSLGQIEDEL
jgi:hypothetical protein